MTPKTPKGAKPAAKKAKRSGLGKETLRDLSPKGDRVRGQGGRRVVPPPVPMPYPLVGAKRV
jgi:hypothetical protein